MPMQQLQDKLLKRALEIAGGESALAVRLGAEPHALSLWLAGRASPPQRIFLVLVDLILQDDLARAAQDRREQPRGSITPIDTHV
jgi:hypothetical protein